MYNFSLGMLCSMICFAYCLLFVKDSPIERDKRLAKEREEMLNLGGKIHQGSQFRLLFSQFFRAKHLNTLSIINQRIKDVYEYTI